MAGEDTWFNGRFLGSGSGTGSGAGSGSGGGGNNNGRSLGNPNTPFFGFSLPVSGLQSSGSGFSGSFSRQTNNFGSFFDPSNSSSSSSSSSSGVAKQEAAFKKIKLADSSNQSTSHHGPIFQVGEGSMVESQQPLGLTLRKTDSFVNLIDKSLAKKKRNYTKMNQRIDQQRIQPKTNNFVPPPSSEKLKATNFPVLVLQIGNWVKKSKHEGQIVGKCYYSKRSLVWELLEGSLKKKIELKWSDISAITVDCIDNDPVILKIELQNPPIFAAETNPQPRKHTNWQSSSDFTGGQASTYRRHYLKFPPGVLRKQYEKLLQCDQRLYILSADPFPSSSNPFFPPGNRSELDFGNGRRPEAALRLLLPSSSNQMYLAQLRQASMQPPVIWDSTSPTSVMEFASIDETVHEHGAERPRKRGLSMVTGNTVSGFSGRDGIQRMPCVSPVIQANQDFGLQGCRMSVDERTMLAKPWSKGSLIRPQQEVHLPDGNSKNQMGFAEEDVSRTEESVRPAAEMGFWEDILGDKCHLPESNTGTELGMTNEQFIHQLLELQQASGLLPTPQFVSQELVPSQQFPAVIENQQANNIQMPRPEFSYRSVFSQEDQLPLTAPTPQLANENQMMHFEGNNSLMASQFLNDNELNQHNGNSSGTSYSNIFPGTQGEDFDDTNWRNQYG